MFTATFFVAGESVDEVDFESADLYRDFLRNTSRPWDRVRTIVTDSRGAVLALLEASRANVENYLAWFEATQS